MSGSVAASALLAAFLLTPLGGWAGELAPSSDRQRELLHLLRHDCGSCHGMTLNGGLGPPLLPSDLEGLPAEGLAAIILNGVPGRPMPPWRALLPAGEVLWLVTQLQAGIDDAH